MQNYLKCKENEKQSHIRLENSTPQMLYAYYGRKSVMPYSNYRLLVINQIKESLCL